MLEHIINTFYGTCWAILPERLEEIETFLRARVADGRVKEFLVFDDERRASKSPALFSKAGPVAVVPIHGTIYPRGGPNAMSGVTTAERIEKSVMAAANDPSVAEIVMDVNSPGGTVAGTAEAAAAIRRAASIKPVHSSVNHMAASGGYWLASQASTLSVAPNGMVGSIGAMWVHNDYSKALEQRGIRITALKTAPFKNDAAPWEGLSKEAAESRMAMLQEFHRQFVGEVAAGRGTTPDFVDQNFGRGGMLLPKQAMAVGMIDRVATLPEIISSIQNRVKNKQKMTMQDRVQKISA